MAAWLLLRRAMSPDDSVWKEVLDAYLEELKSALTRASTLAEFESMLGAS